MDYRTEYSITEEIQSKSLKQYFFKALLGKQIVLIPLMIVFSLALLFISDDDFGFYAGVVLGCMALVYTIIWTKSYFLILKQGREQLALLDSPTIKIRMNEDGIHYESSNNSRSYSWSKIEKLEDTGDFLVFQKGKIPLLNLPKEFLDKDALEYAKSKITQPGSPYNSGQSLRD